MQTIALILLLAGSSMSTRDAQAIRRTEAIVEMRCASTNYDCARAVREELKYVPTHKLLNKKHKLKKRRRRAK